MSWLVDDAALIYIILGCVAVGSAVAWWRTRQGKFALGTAIAAGLIVLVYCFGLFFPSDSRRITKALQEMSEGVRTRDLNRIFAQVSDRFQQGPPTFSAAVDKEAFRKRAEEIIKSRNVEQVVVWDPHFEELSHTARTARVVFSAKAKGNWGSEVPYLVRADFVLDPDGQWRMKGFQVFNPVVNTRDPIQIPGM
jgi:hypothetical protein